jgi:hypothetical protein
LVIKLIDISNSIVFHFRLAKISASPVQNNVLRVH